MDDFIKTEESATMFVVRDKSILTNLYRRRLMSTLEIPTYDRGKKIMFYDVLQKVVLRAFKVQHN